MVITTQAVKTTGTDLPATTQMRKKVQLDNFVTAWKCLMTDFEDGFSPLTLAVKEGHVSAVRNLVQLGADVNAADKSGRTPWERADPDNYMDMMRTLTDVGAVFTTSDDKGTPLVNVAANYDKAVIVSEGGGAPKYAMKKDQLDNFIAAWKCLMSDYEDGFSPLTLAVKEGYVGAVRELVELGADVNYPAGGEYLPLDRAIQGNNVDMIRTLVEGGADVNITRNKVISYSPPVSTAAYMVRVAALRVFAELGGDGCSPAHTAAQEGHVDVIRALVELGANIHTPDEDGCTPMHMAALKGQVGAIRALAELGANVNTPMEDGRTPVYMAAQVGQEDAIRALAEHGANVITPDEDGCTPVFIAAQEGQVGAIRALAELGANVNTPMEDGRTPIFTAAMNGKAGVIRALAEFGANIHTPDEIGFFPIHVAAKGGHVCVVRALAEHGANVNTPDGVGRTPLYIAAQQREVAAMRALIGLRADIDKGSHIYSTPLHRVLVDVNHIVEASLLLVKSGADVSLCLIRLILAETEHIREMMTQLFDSVSLSSNHSYDGAVTCAAKCSLFSLTKLMSSASRGDDSGDERDDAAIGRVVEEETSEEHTAFETAIANSLQQHMSVVVITQMQGICYVLKRRLVRVAWRVYQSSLVLDGDRITLAVKTRRYMELVCFLFDSALLDDVLALRMTCKSNSERRRFPVYSLNSYQELEANIIEECVAYGSSRFVSTDVLHAVMAIHRSY